MSEMHNKAEHRGHCAVPLVRRFAALWDESSAPPDIEPFLVDGEVSSSADVADLIRFDQIQRAKLRQLLPVEEYFAMSARPPLDDDGKVAGLTINPVTSYRPTLESLVVR